MANDIKSLIAKIRSAPRITPDIVDAMNELAHLQMDTDLNNAYDMSTAAIGHAQAIGYPEGEAEALIHAGVCASRQRRFDEAASLYQKALEIKTALGDAKGIANVYSKLGNSKLRAGDYIKALASYGKAIEILQDTEDHLALADIHANTGLIHGLQGNYTTALKFHLQALKTFQRLNEKARIASSSANIGLIYTEQRNFEDALKVFQQALEIRQEAKAMNAVADLYINMGIVHQEQQKFDEALNAFHKALHIYEVSGDDHLIATAFSNTGNVHKNKGENTQALDYYMRALFLFEKVNDKRGLLQSYNNLGELYFELGDEKQAHHYLSAAVRLAGETGLKNQLRVTYQFLAQLYAHEEKYQEAYQYQRLFSELDREISNAEIRGQMAQMALRHELEQKEQMAEIERTKNAELQKAYNLIEAEKKRSEELLLNILPIEVSEELKTSGKTKARSYKMVTVLFTDIKAFTKISAQFSAEEIVSSIDEYFETFDMIVEKHGVEKIKTIGDAYLCAGGMPVATPDHALKMILVAKDFIKAVTHLREKRTAEGKHAFDFRVGIHSGPLVAGVVGIKKFAYDIWGDTVNTASRMQSNGEPNRINISESTYELIKDKFHCIYRGEIEAKNKGPMKMYFVE